MRTGFNLDEYLNRIDYAGPRHVGLDTLTGIHRAHLLAIPYENLDIQLGRRLTVCTEAAAEKLIRQRRGGWCYEMNAVFGRALTELGFSVTALAGGVRRPNAAEADFGTHMVFRVDLHRPYLCDVGFGDGLLEPMRLTPGVQVQGSFLYRLEQDPGGLWRFSNQSFTGLPHFEFYDEPAGDGVFERHCRALQTDPASPFLLNAVVKKHIPGGIRMLVGRIFQEFVNEDSRDFTVDNAADYARVLRGEFGLDLPETAALWPRIAARHEELFGLRATGT